MIHMYMYVLPGNQVSSLSSQRWLCSKKVKDGPLIENSECHIVGFCFSGNIIMLITRWNDLS